MLKNLGRKPHVYLGRVVIFIFISFILFLFYVFLFVHRVIRFRGYCEQEDIQKDAMIPAKEAKLLTYKLLEEHFLQVRS